MKRICAVLVVLLFGVSAMLPAMEAATNPPPVANAGPDKLAAPGDTVYFDGSDSYDPDGQPINYSWDFDDSDGIQMDATGATVNHVYMNEGVYTVTLTVSDANASSADTSKVTISADHVNQAPTAVIAEPADFALVNNTAPVTFSGNGSSDPDGDLLTYKWDFGDNVKADGKNVQHRYASAGVYTVSLNVSDGQLSNAASITLLVEGTPGGPPPVPPPPIPPTRPQVQAGGPYIGMALDATQLDSSGTKPGGNGNATYCWDLDARNGIQAQYCFDEQAALTNYWDVAYGLDPAVAWKIPGNYTITLIVRSERPRLQTLGVTEYLYGYNTTNAVIMAHNTVGVDAGRDRQIKNNEKTSLMGRVWIKDGKYRDERVVECDWDFNNDGTVDYKIQFDSTENLKDASCPAIHTYTVNGTTKNETVFVTKLTGIADGFAHLYPASNDQEVVVNYTVSGDDTINLTIPAPPDIPPIVTCGPDKTGDNAAFVGEQTEFTASASDPDNDKILSYEWDFDSSGTIDYTSSSSGAASYTYTSAGGYMAVLNVTDARKATTFCYVNVTVLENKPPSAVISAPSTAKAGDPVLFDGSESSDPDGPNEITSYSWDFDASDGISVDAVGKEVTHTYSKGGMYTATLVVEDKHSAKSQPATADITIGQTYGVTFESTGSTSADIEPGKSQMFTFKVTNTGNGDDCFDLEKSGSKTTWGDLSANQVCMKSGEFKSITLRATVPSTAVAGDSATIKVSATSKGSADAKEEVQVRITAKQSYGVDLHMEEIMANVNAGDSKTLSIRVSNLGNGKDTMKFTTDGADKTWISFKVDSLSLEAKEIKESTITISVPDNAKSGDHVITLTTYSMGDNTQRSSVVLTITVKAKSVPKFIPGFDPAMVLLALALAFVVAGAWKGRKERA